MNRFGGRNVHMVGSIVCSVGCICMAFSPNMKLLFLSAAVQGIFIKMITWAIK